MHTYRVSLLHRCTVAQQVLYQLLAIIMYTYVYTVSLLHCCTIGIILLDIIMYVRTQFHCCTVALLHYTSIILAISYNNVYVCINTVSLLHRCTTGIIIMYMYTYMQFPCCTVALLQVLAILLVIQSFTGYYNNIILYYYYNYYVHACMYINYTFSLTVGPLYLCMHNM